MGLNSDTEGGFLASVQMLWGKAQFVPAPAVITSKLVGITMSDVTAMLAVMLLVVQIASAITDKWGKWAPLPGRILRASAGLLSRLYAIVRRKRVDGDQCGASLPPAANGKGKATVVAPAAALVAIVMALGVSEGDVRTPYRDAAGFLTVCKGITGPAVVVGKTYTARECALLESTAVKAGTDAMARCLGVPLEWFEWVAWGHFVHNVGATAFCTSEAARQLRAGQHGAACTQIPRWRYVTIAGAPRDCREKRWDCAGIIHRRAWEKSMCEGRIPATDYPAIEAWLQERAA